MDWNEEVQRGKNRRRENLKSRNPHARELQKKQYQPKVQDTPYKRVRIRKEDIEDEEPEPRISGDQWADAFWDIWDSKG